ncbi:MAG: hypothetical protein ACK5M7_09930 [Draconibacterium sp.]
MIRALLKIRLKQIYRGIMGIGLIRFIFLVGLVGFLGFALYVKSTDKATSQYLSTGFLLLIMFVHFKREDILFLRSHFSNYKTLVLAEYIILAIPLVCCFLIHKQWIAISELLGLLIIVNLDLKARHSNLNTKLQELIPSDAFEWKAGVRKHFFVIVPIWIIAALTSFFVGSIPIAIFILGITILSFFEKCEPYQILLSLELNVTKFLMLKVKRLLQLFSIIVIPLLVLFIIFNPYNWYIPVAEYFIFCSLLVYAIMTKYAFYEPNVKSSVAQIYVAIGALGGIIPVFLPVMWLLTILFYLKSVNNLNFYLDDYN